MQDKLAKNVIDISISVYLKICWHSFKRLSVTSDTGEKKNFLYFTIDQL